MATAYPGTGAVQDQEPQTCSGKFTLRSARRVATQATINGRIGQIAGELRRPLQEINRLGFQIPTERTKINKCQSESTQDGVYRKGDDLLLNKETQEAYWKPKPVS